MGIVPKSSIEWIEPKRLRLDPQNPRLPEDMDGSVSEDVIRFYWDNYVLDELIDSFKENGYFEIEPMIVTPEDPEHLNSTPMVVLEGNRRLAAIIQLLRLPGYVEEIEIDPPTLQLRAALRSIPCYVTDRRASVASHLGFKHIGGLKPWSPEAKARFVASEVRQYAKTNQSGNPFAHIARMVGTNAQSVRIAFFALELLRFARDTLGLSTGYVADYRFGVWLRAMSSKGIVERMCISLPKTFEELDVALKNVDSKWLKAVIADLSPSDGLLPILADSRDVTTYGYVLANDRAYDILKSTRDLRVAEQIVSGATLSNKIDRVTKRVAALVTESEQLEETDAEALASARVLAARAKALVNTLRADEELE